MSVDAPLHEARLGQLSLAALRAYRQLLQEEEQRVSYWRRLLQARLDLAAAGRLSIDPVRPEELAALLARGSVRGERLALLPVAAEEDVPELPGLAPLWQTELTGPAGGDAAVVAAAAEAESQLSTYRGSLHRLLDLATAELVRRYRDDPAACLAALQAPTPACPLAAGT